MIKCDEAQQLRLEPELQNCGRQQPCDMRPPSEGPMEGLCNISASGRSFTSDSDDICQRIT